VGLYLFLFQVACSQRRIKQYELKHGNKTDVGLYLLTMYMTTEVCKSSIFNNSSLPMTKACT